MQNGRADGLPVAVEVDADTGRWSVDGLPMVLVPQHLIVNNLDAVERRLGRAESTELFRESGRRSARRWCAHESARLGLSGAETVRHYLDRLTRRGWGTFHIDQLDLSQGLLRVRVTHSALLPTPETPRSIDRTCYLFEAWFEGALEYVSPESATGAMREVQCAAHTDACVFAST